MKRPNFELFFSYFCADLNLQRCILLNYYSFLLHPTVSNSIFNSSIKLDEDVIYLFGKIACINALHDAIYNILDSFNENQKCSK